MARIIEPADHGSTPARGLDTPHSAHYAGPSGRSMLARFTSFARAEPIAAAAAVIASLGALTLVAAWFFQYVVGLQPCPLCYEQRIAYYVAIPLAAMIMLGVSVGASHKVLLAALLAIAAAMLWNAGLGVYHSGIEWHWWAGPQDCSGPVVDFGSAGGLLERMQTQRVVRCDEAAWRFLGLSMAGYNVLISLALAAVALGGAAGGFRTRPIEAE
jgi:disulfide bond formation protein DsbB